MKDFWTARHTLVSGTGQIFDEFGVPITPHSGGPVDFETAGLSPTGSFYNNQLNAPFDLGSDPNTPTLQEHRECNASVFPGPTHKTLFASGISADFFGRFSVNVSGEVIEWNHDPLPLGIGSVYPEFYFKWEIAGDVSGGWEPHIVSSVEGDTYDTATATVSFGTMDFVTLSGTKEIDLWQSNEVDQYAVFTDVELRLVAFT